MFCCFGFVCFALYTRQEGELRSCTKNVQEYGARLENNGPLFQMEPEF